MKSGLEGRNNVPQRMPSLPPTAAGLNEVRPGRPEQFPALAETAHWFQESQ